MSPSPQNPQFGQATILGQQQQQKLQAQIQAAMNQLSLQIYTHLATAHIATRDLHNAVDQEQLRQLAKDSQVAGRCYFEGIGVIQREKEGEE